MRDRDTISFAQSIKIEQGINATCGHIYVKIPAKLPAVQHGDLWYLRLDTSLDTAPQVCFYFLFLFPEKTGVDFIIRCRLCTTLLDRLVSPLSCMDCSLSQVKHPGEGYVSRISTSYDRSYSAFVHFLGDYKTLSISFGMVIICCGRGMKMQKPMITLEYAIYAHLDLHYPGMHDRRVVKKKKRKETYLAGRSIRHLVMISDAENLEALFRGRAGVHHLKVTIFINSEVLSTTDKLDSIPVAVT